MWSFRQREEFKRILKGWGETCDPEKYFTVLKTYPPWRVLDLLEKMYYDLKPVPTPKRLKHLVADSFRKKPLDVPDTVCPYCEGEGTFPIRVWLIPSNCWALEYIPGRYRVVMLGRRFWIVEPWLGDRLEEASAYDMALYCDFCQISIQDSAEAVLSVRTFYRRYGKRYATRGFPDLFEFLMDRIARSHEPVEPGMAQEDVWCGHTKRPEVNKSWYNVVERIKGIKSDKRRHAREGRGQLPERRPPIDQET